MFLRTLNCVSRIGCYVSLAASFIPLAVSSCVQPERVEVLEREQRQLQTNNTSQQKQLDETRASLADTRASLQQVQRDVSSLKESIEETRHQVGRQIDNTSRAGDERVKELEAKVAKLTEGLSSQGEQLRKGIQYHPALPAEGTETAAAENDAIRRDYESAWRVLEKKDYRNAIPRFKDFIKKYPKSTLAGNAQYWIGESHYALREFEQAIIEFDAVRTRYPQTEKVAPSLLKQAYAFAELGENQNARVLLQEIVDKYAQTPEGTQAQQKLKTLES